MQCTKCGSTLKPGTQCCLSCGNSENTPGNSGQKPPTANKTPAKGYDPLKIFVLLAVLGGLIFAYNYSTGTSNKGDDLVAMEEAIKNDHTVKPQLHQPVEGQLKALKNHDFSKAYNGFASKKFKDATTLEAFQNFVQSTPLLINYDTITIVKTDHENGKGFVTVKLKGKGEEVVLEYTLVEENGNWKVQGFRLDKTEESVSQNETQAPIIVDEATIEKAKNALQANPEYNKIMTTINGQLDALRSHDVAKAYYDYTSKEFQEATSLDQYEEAISDYPLMTDHKNVDFDYAQMDINNNRASLTAILKDSKESILIDYVLIKVGDDWKIWGSEIKDIADEPLKAEREVTKTPFDQDKKNVTDVIERQLESLKQNDLRKAYEFVSKEFEQATPYPNFEEFVKKYPILTQHKKVVVGDVVYDKDKANVMVILQSPEHNNPMEYTLVKSGDNWKVFGFRILIPDEKLELSQSDKSEIMAIVTDQLAALKTDDVNKAYSETAKEFRDATSFEAFSNFIKSYPIFKDSKNTNYSNPTTDNQIVILTAALTSEKGNAEIEYRFVKDKDTKKWKIWSMNVVRNNTSASRPASMKSSDLLQIIAAQLTAIKGNDISKAYHDYTSKEFQSATNYSAFEQFVQRNPVISKNKDMVFSNLTFENDIGTYEGKLTSVDGETEPVKYRLVYEDNAWKILSINILYSPTPVAKALEFNKVIFGTEVDLEGKVTNPTTSIHSDQAKITSNVYIRNGTAGTTVEVVLEHVGTGSKIAPVSTSLDKNGDSIVSFVFTPPTQGWPKGDYKLHVNASTGEQTTAEFKVE